MGSKSTIPYFRIFIWILYAVTIAAIVYIVSQAYDYYLTPYAQRIRHVDYKLLKPGGLISHGIGIVGTLMLISLLLYSLRKRFRFMSQIGNLSHWLDIHIFFGICGTLLVVLHSTFKLNGLVSVSFWSMVIVALSGVLGRYLYTQIPRNISGTELTLQQVKSQAEALYDRLVENYGLSALEIEAIEQILKPTKTTLFAAMNSDLFRYFRHRKVRQYLKKNSDVPGWKQKKLIHATREKMVLERRIALWNRVHELFHYWHVFHKPLAIIMYIILTVHVSIAIWLGYTWIL